MPTRTVGRFIVTLCLAPLPFIASLSGCASNTDNPQATDPKRNYTPEQVAKMLDPDVVGVLPLYDSFDPWLWNESHEKPNGIVIRALYLMGSKYKGVFGDGIIRPKLFVREINRQGEATWTLAKEWALNVEQAMLFRSKRQSVMGWGYRLHLEWPELSKLAGREVRLVVEFERKDGQKVASDKKDFRVPAPNA